MSERWGLRPSVTHRSLVNFRWSAPAALLLAFLTAVAGLLLPAVLAGPASAAAAGQGQIYVVHGIVGQTLDVYVDGKKVLAAAKPKTIVGPLALDAGSHQVILRKGTRTVAQSKFEVSAGQSLDVVAHLRSDSKAGATITAYRNNTTAVGPDKLRLVVAHTAAAPPADIRVDGKVLFSNVANGEALTEVVPSATYKVEVVPATGGAAILGPVDLKLQKGTLTRVYAIGNVATGSMDAIVHTLPIKVSGAAAPSSVPTGNGGQAAGEFVTSHTGTTEAMAASALGLLAVAGLIAMVGRRMRKRVAL